jgi:hypothetical protein
MRVRQAVSINAPVDQAFAYLNDPENSLALIPSLVEVREIAPLANRFEELPTGPRLETEVEYRVDVPWPQKVLTPVVEFQLRRPMRRQLRSLLSVVKGRIETASLHPS